MSTIIIEERSGRRRKVELRGAGLPFQGAGWGAGLVVATTRNAGARTSTQHVLAFEELPSEWEGEWNTTRLISAPPAYSEEGGAAQPIVNADTLRDALEQIFLGAVLLRVTWVARENRRIVRLGRATEWNFSHIRADDIRWNITFEWIGRDEDRPKSSIKGEGLVAATRAAVLAATNAATEIETARIRASNRQLPASASAFDLGQLEALADGPRELVDSFARFATAVGNRFRHVGDLLVKVRETPAGIAGQLVDIARNAVAESNRFCDQMSREGPETMSTRNKVSALLNAMTYYSGAQTQAELLADEALRAARAAQQRKTARQRAGEQPGAFASPDDVTGAHMPREGETMTTIALKYYQADLGYELARANGLPGQTIKPPPRMLVLMSREALLRFSPGKA